MQAIYIHDTETEEIIGLVSPVEPIDFNKFEDEVIRTWTKFNSEELDFNYDIEDFVEYHNENSTVKIESVFTGYIQL